MRRILIVANKTLGGHALADAVHARMADGPCSFHIVVPAVPPTGAAVWTEGEAEGIAHERLDRALAWFAREGAEATGAVGVARPMLAIFDALVEQDFDEIIISTLHPGVSRWIGQDLPARARRRFEVPVSHVIADAAPAKRSA